MPRKKPFSAKQKKVQLFEKKERKRQQQQPKNLSGDFTSSGYQKWHDSESDLACSSGKSISTNSNSHQDKSTVKQAAPNRYKLQFFREGNEEIAKRKAEAQKPYQTVTEKELETDVDEIYHPGSVLDIPKRPAWNYSLSKKELEDKEEIYFRDYLDGIFSKYEPGALSYFEMNLETWRQLWRVLEMADMILLITDIRHPALHFSPALYTHVTSELKKPLVLVLNKIDLAPPSLVVAWKHYFKKKFPQLKVVCFASFPKEKEYSSTTEKDPGKMIHKTKVKGKFTAVGPQELFKVCQEIIQDQVDLKSWQDKLESDLAGIETLDPVMYNESLDDSDSKHTQYKDGILSIGCVGYPNVGKSSLMNSLIGKKVVRVSRTPGCTKYFQTYFLSPTVKLCDCPGLVFPSMVAKPLQILAGICPVAQVREPYTAVMYLAERIELPKLLKLRHPNAESNKPYNGEWSAYDICDAWAEKRGFLTARAAKTDLHRAANNILHLVVEGRLCLCFRPPAYLENKSFWESHSDTQTLGLLQDFHRCKKTEASGIHEHLSYSNSEEEN